MAKYSAASGATGALSGAASGAAIGSVVPGLGTAVGAGVGGLVGGLAGLFGSKKKKAKAPKRISTLDPRQQALYNSYVRGLRGKGSLSSLFNYDAEGANQNFDQNVARPAYRDFQENIIPNITGQYRQGNLMNSTYSGEALGRAGRNVQENLDAQRSNMQFGGQQQSQQNKLNSINSVLGMNTFAYQQPNHSNSIDNILSSVAPQAGQWFGDYLRDARRSNTAAPAQPAPPTMPTGSISNR